MKDRFQGVSSDEWRAAEDQLKEEKVGGPSHFNCIMNLWVVQLIFKEHMPGVLSVWWGCLASVATHPNSLREPLLLFLCARCREPGIWRGVGRDYQVMRPWLESEHFDSTTMTVSKIPNGARWVSHGFYPQEACNWSANMLFIDTHGLPLTSYIKGCHRLLILTNQL